MYFENQSMYGPCVIETQNKVNNKLSVIHVLDKDGKLQDVFSKQYDFQNIGDTGIIDLNQHVIDAIQKRPTY
ncbi:5'-AMP-activated_protein [Hexamita inflata]|uniref:5'-AMP-activated_protein n=1 Tax=Hexamita inflata TaxID=28002 RepID=A0ABP1JS41_9EUKA